MKNVLRKAEEKVAVIRCKASNLMVKASPAVIGGIVVVNSFATQVNAAGDAKGLLEEIIKIIGGLIIALGVIYAVMGIINYASAHSEGDGPAQNKAIGKIAAGIMLVALSITLETKAGDLAGFITA